MSQPAQPNPGPPPADRPWTSPNPEPRSPVLRGLLYVTSAIAWTIGAATLTSVWETSPFVGWLTTNASWLVWPLGLAVALYLTHRVYVLVVGPAPDIDDAIRKGELVPPGPISDGEPPPAPNDGDPATADRPPLPECVPDHAAHRLLLRALGEVRVHVFDADAILAVYHAVAAALESEIGRTGSNGYQRLRTEVRANLAVVLAELVDSGHLHRTGSDRYTLPDKVAGNCRAPALSAREETDPDRVEEMTELALKAALPALLRHLADLAARWAGALDHRRHAHAAARWFEAKEPTLSEMILACEPSDDQRAGVVRDVAQLADALDRWYVRRHRPRAARDVARRVRALADRAGKPVLRDLSAFRAGAANRLLGDPHGPEPEYGARLAGRSRRPGEPRAPQWHRLAVALHARERHERALTAMLLARLDGTETAASGPAAAPATTQDGAMATVDRADRLELIERTLNEAWRSLPRAEVGNVVATLINLAIVHLYQGRFEAADDRLELAESLTRNDIAPAGRAQALELRGVVAWTRGHPRRATALWYDAYTLFHELGMDDARQHCAVHLASAMAKVPGLRDVLHELDHPPCAELWEDLAVPADAPNTASRHGGPGEDGDGRGTHARDRVERYQTGSSDRTRARTRGDRLLRLIGRFWPFPPYRGRSPGGV